MTKLMRRPGERFADWMARQPTQGASMTTMAERLRDRSAAKARQLTNPRSPAQGAGAWHPGVPWVEAFISLCAEREPRTIEQRVAAAIELGKRKAWPAGERYGSVADFIQAVKDGKGEAGKTASGSSRGWEPVSPWAIGHCEARSKKPPITAMGQAADQAADDETKARHHQPSLFGGK